MDENVGSTNSLRNLPVGRMDNIRKMFETGAVESPNECSPVYTSSNQTAMSDNVATPPKPTPRVKPKLSELPAKPKIYSVPIYKPPLNVTTSENNSSSIAAKPQVSPKKIPVKPNANTNQQASPRRSSNEQTATQSNPVNSDITSELEVRLRRRQDGNAIRKQHNRKSEPGFNPSNNLPKPVPSPKRFSGNYDKSSQLNGEQVVEKPAKPRSGSDNSGQEEPIGKLDISEKAKIFETKKTPPERPVAPKFKPGHVRQRSAGSVPEYARVNKPANVPHPVSMAIKKDDDGQETSLQQPLPPSKPPRTHAHDQYLLTKIKKGEVIIDENVIYQSLEDEKPMEEDNIFTMPIRERISQMHQRPHSQDDYRRLYPPARPPPPKQRHATDLKLPSASNSAVKETWFFSKEAPEIPDSKPPLEVYESALPFKKYGTLPRKPKTTARKNRPFSDESDQNRDSMKRFPLRKSLSSECLQRKENGSEHYYEDPSELIMRDVPYEAYVDQEGYAVPNKFVKVKLTDKLSEDPNMAHDRPFSEALKARFDDLKKKIVPENKSSSSSSSQTSEDPVKVNKKCRNFVRDRINQAFSIVRRYVRRKSETGLEPDTLDSESLSDDSDSFVDVHEILKRKTYASTIRKKTSPSIKKSVQFVDKIYPQLFEYAVIVGLRPVPADQGFEAYIIHKFPEIRNYTVSTQGNLYVCTNMVDSNVSVPLFCFPDANDYKVDKNLKSEKYSFVLTNFDGGRVYGYCKRLQMPNCNLPEVICIISPIEANNMYNTLLNEIERKRLQSLELAQELLAASFGRPLPKPGQDIQIRSLDVEGELETILLHRPSEARLENVQYECLLTYLGTDKLIKTFSTLLLERRVILCSNSLSTLTHVVQAVVALLYPFHWEHVYIPILPEAMLDVCCSPTPFIIGILSSHLSQVLDKPLDEVLIIDLDKKTVITSVGDESTLLPKKITKALKMAINMCKIDIEAERSQALMISEAFLRVFVETVGHYGEFITTQQDNKKVFLKENFIARVESQGLQQFLEWFTETQMFEVFITNHLEKRDWGTVDVFMTRVMEYKDGVLPQTEKPGIGMKVKNLGKAIKSKLT